MWVRSEQATIHFVPDEVVVMGSRQQECGDCIMEVLEEGGQVRNVDAGRGGDLDGDDVMGERCAGGVVGHHRGSKGGRSGGWVSG